MNILVTIAGRGGSKGVPDKNIRPLAGKPLIAHSIEQAKKWGRAKHIVVSSDSQKIIEVAKKYGALAPFVRPNELAGDTADKLSVIRHALEEYETKYELVVYMDITAPLRKKNDLENMYQLFTQKKPKLIFSVVTAHKNPYFNMVELENGVARLCKHLNSPITRRQDAPKVYAMNASLYFYHPDFLKTNPKSLFTDQTLIYEMDDVSGIDIDREIDFQLVEFLMQKGLC